MNDQKILNPVAYLRSDDLKKLAMANIAGEVGITSVYGAMHIRAMATKDFADQYGNDAAVITIEQAEGYKDSCVRQAISEIAVFLNMICAIDKQGECEEIAMDAMNHIRSVIKTMDNSND